MSWLLGWRFLPHVAGVTAVLIVLGTAWKCSRDSGWDARDRVAVEEAIEAERANQETTTDVENAIRDVPRGVPDNGDAFIDWLRRTPTAASGPESEPDPGRAAPVAGDEQPQR